MIASVALKAAEICMSEDAKKSTPLPPQSIEKTADNKLQSSLLITCASATPSSALLAMQSRFLNVFHELPYKCLAPSLICFTTAAAFIYCTSNQEGTSLQV